VTFVCGGECQNARTLLSRHTAAFLLMLAGGAGATELSRPSEVEASGDGRDSTLAVTAR
jgi:hypothetical protein